MKKIIFLIILNFIFSGTVFAEVSQFVFTNEQRTVAPSVISESLTIQSQNSGGTQESIVETTDLTFQSSSPTGEFLNSSGNLVSTTMSKNTSNRTFYYRDSSIGSHTLTVTATGRESKKVFNTSQIIFVGVSNPNSTVTTSTDVDKDESSSTTETSSHSSPAPSSGSREIMSFEVSAGRERFTSVASDVVFKAEPVKLSGVPEQYIQYSWSFGDGVVAQGPLVSHRYRFPGEYVVVLNASYSDKSAVSRTKVLVIDPAFELSVVAGGVRVLNKSSGEVNLGEWVIEGVRSKLDIPRDTIIQKGNAVTFVYGGVITDTDVLTLKNPLGSIIAERKVVEKVEPTIVAEEPAIMESSIPSVKIVYVDRPVVSKKVVETQTPIVTDPTGENSAHEVVTNDQVASVYVAQPKVSALENFLWIPKKGWGMISNLFK